MPQQMIITIPGQPIALKRHRTSFRNGIVIAYDSQKKEKQKILNIIKSQVDGHPLQPEIISANFLAVYFQFYFKIPKSKTKSIQEGDYCNTTPDASNCVKLYEDIMNGHIIADDRIIVESHQTKNYSINPRTVIIIEKIKNRLL